MVSVIIYHLPMHRKFSKYLKSQKQFLPASDYDRSWSMV